MNKNESGSEPIQSDFEGDPQMRDLIDLFVSEMPSKASRLSDLFDGQQVDDLQRMAHQLKGAAGGYGFGSISEAAADLEQTLKAQDELESARSQVEQLIDLCQRTRSTSE
jgi:HPt (histidine-containing phosphotransfer) domain-containing protein